MAKNCRPISTTLAMGKVFKSLVNTAAIKHLDSNVLLTSNQHSLRQRKLTKTNLITLNYLKLQLGAI